MNDYIDYTEDIYKLDLDIAKKKLAITKIEKGTVKRDKADYALRLLVAERARKQSKMMDQRYLAGRWIAPEPDHEAND
jgi:hypothetical protein